MIRLTRYKLIAFIISAAIAGFAGATKSIAYQFAVLDDIRFQMSGLIVLMTLLGGAGTIFGPLVGATIVVALESLLATSPFPVPVITGAVYILCVLMFRRGISRRAHAEMTEREGRAEGGQNSTNTGSCLMTKLEPKQVAVVTGGATGNALAEALVAGCKSRWLTETRQRFLGLSHS